MKKLILSGLLITCCSWPVAAQETGQRTFKTPQEAAQAFLEAARAGQPEGMAALVGANARAILSTGEAAQDSATRQAFLKAAQEKLKLVPVNDSLQLIEVGAEGFPLPLPLVNKHGNWYFDGALALEEVRARRIGRNELRVIGTCKAYIEAQREYAALDPEADGVYDYAQRLISQPGKHDGLYWAAAPGEVQSPLGPMIAQAGGDGPTVGHPFHGYAYRILTGQGANAPGGAFSYVINGNMVAGSALLAYPAEYGKTGIMTFMVGPNGVVYERDFKGETPQSVTSFDPGPGWKRI